MRVEIRHLFFFMESGRRDFIATDHPRFQFSQLFPISLIAACVTLAACGTNPGGLGSNYAETYDPQDAVHSAPIPVTVIGTPGPGIAPSAAEGAVADALKSRQVGSGRSAPVGGTQLYSLTVLFGPVAVATVAAGDSDNDFRLCELLHRQTISPASAPGADGALTVPTLAVLCRGDEFMSSAYGRVPLVAAADDAALRADLGHFVDTVFPPLNWVAYTNGNKG